MTGPRICPRCGATNASTLRHMDTGAGGIRAAYQCDGCLAALTDWVPHRLLPCPVGHLPRWLSGEAPATPQFRLPL